MKLFITLLYNKKRTCLRTLLYVLTNTTERILINPFNSFSFYVFLILSEFLF